MPTLTETSSLRASSPGASTPHASFPRGSSSRASPSCALSPNLVILLSGKRKSGKDFVAEILTRHFSSSNPDSPPYLPPLPPTHKSPLKTAIIRLSAPLKKRFADEHGLDFDKLLDSSEYKERYRKAMIVWGEERRRCDPGFFCRAAIEDALSDQSKVKDATLIERSSKTAQTSSSQGELSLLPSTSTITTTPPSVTTASLQSQVWIISDARRLTDLQFFRKNYPDVLLTIRVFASETCRRRRGWVWTSEVDDAESECGLDDVSDWDFILNNDDDDDQNGDDEGRGNGRSNGNVSNNNHLNLADVISKLDSFIYPSHNSR